MQLRPRALLSFIDRFFTETCGFVESQGLVAYFTMTDTFVDAPVNKNKTERTSSFTGANATHSTQSHTHFKYVAYGLIHIQKLSATNVSIALMVASS
jgi:hypothetical protein